MTRPDFQSGDRVRVGGAADGVLVCWHELDPERADVRIGSAVVSVRASDLTDGRPVALAWEADEWGDWVRRCELATGTASKAALIEPGLWHADLPDNPDPDDWSNDGECDSVEDGKRQADAWLLANGWRLE